MHKFQIGQVRSDQLSRPGVGVGVGGHEGRFSRNLLPVFSPGVPCEQGRPTLQGALKDGFGEAVVAWRMTCLNHASFDIGVSLTFSNNIYATELCIPFHFELHRVHPCRFAFHLRRAETIWHLM